MRSTTIVAARRDRSVAIGGDGQVTLGDVAMKHQAVKVRRMYEDRVIAGFAGSAADALALFEKLEGRLEEFHGSLPRAAVELAKDWRSDRALRRLEAQIIACDADVSLLVSGGGDVLSPDDGVVAIGSGSSIALGVSRTLLKHTELSAEEVVREALLTAADICIYTNDHITVESLSW
jgi:ATP-dependent HslUV protease, peptidase subunit HslV